MKTTIILAVSLAATPAFAVSSGATMQDTGRPRTTNARQKNGEAAAHAGCTNAEAGKENPDTINKIIRCSGGASTSGPPAKGHRGAEEAPLKRGKQGTEMLHRISVAILPPFTDNILTSN
jgi:hypothetical protein